MGQSLNVFGYDSAASDTLLFEMRRAFQVDFEADRQRREAEATLAAILMRKREELIAEKWASQEILEQEQQQKQKRALWEGQVDILEQQQAREAVWDSRLLDNGTDIHDVLLHPVIYLNATTNVKVDEDKAEQALAALQAGIQAANEIAYYESVLTDYFISKDSRVVWGATEGQLGVVNQNDTDMGAYSLYSGTNDSNHKLLSWTVGSTLRLDGMDDPATKTEAMDVHLARLMDVRQYSL